VSRSEPSGARCADCETQPARIALDGIDLCDQCFDRRIATATGYSELPEPPPPESLRGADGRIHQFRYRIWRAPTGIAVEADEVGRAPDEGYHAKVLGSHEADVGRLVTRVRIRLQQRVGHLDLEDRPGWQPMIAGDALTGRLVWSGQGEPYDVVVDGRRLTWAEFGRALEPFEGWAFRLIFEDLETVDDGDA
jgi:hypothetical protein